MNKSISRNLTLSLIIVVTLVSVTPIFISYIRSSREAMRELEARASEYATSIANMLSHPLWNMDKSAINQIGNFYFSYADIEKIKISDDLGEVYLDLKKGRDEPLIVKTSEVYHGGTLVGRLQISLSEEKVREINKRILFAGLLTIFIIVLSMVIMTGFLLRRFLKNPLNALSAIVDSYSSGNSGPAAYDMPFVEFKPFVTVLKDMRNRIDLQMEQLQRSHNELERRVEERTKELAESEEKFKILTEKSLVGVYLIQDNIFQYVNAKAAEIIGYSVDEITGKMPVKDIVFDEDLHILEENFRRRFSGEVDSVNYEIRLKRKSGRIIYGEVFGSRMDFRGRPSIIGTFMDITERKKAEETLREKARLEDERRNLLEKERMLMELHDGLGGITTNISLLAELASNSSRTEEMKKLIETIAALSKEGHFEVRTFMQGLDSKGTDWHTLGAELRKQGISMLEPHGIAFDMALSLENAEEQPGSLIYINLFRVFKEAITNIIKHSEAKTVNVALGLTSDKLTLAIKDNGMGGKRGKGRGISNMKVRAEEIGGDLNVTFKNGTTVCLEVPMPLKYPDRAVNK